MLFLKCATLAPKTMLEAARNLRQMAFNSLCNIVIVMCLSTQLILGNAVWRKFLFASSMVSGAEEANLENNIASQK